MVALCALYSSWVLLPRAWRARLSARLRGEPLPTGDAPTDACGGCGGCGGGGLGRSCATDAPQAKVIRIVRPGDPS
jgi:hypothetical protein